MLEKNVRVVYGHSTKDNFDSNGKHLSNSILNNPKNKN